SHSTYGTKFLIPFPEVDPSTTLPNQFEYQVYITNPDSGTAVVTVIKTAADGTNQSAIYDIMSRSAKVLYIPYSFMMHGEGMFQQHLEITSPTSISVQVLGTHDMDGFVAHPVQAWDKVYRPVTYWIESGGEAVLVIVAEQATRVTITIPMQDSKHLSIYDTLYPAPEETVLLDLAAGEVYQLKRDYDITGCLVTAALDIGVLSGSDFTWVGSGLEDGAFYDWVPGRTKQGTDFVVTLTPGRNLLGDVVLVMAYMDDTHIIISTDSRRITLNSGEHIMRIFYSQMIHVESDFPVTVVKFGQSGGIQGVQGHPTMTYIPPTVLYMRNEVFVFKEIEGFASMEQTIVVVGTVGGVQCVADWMGMAPPTQTLHGTNLVMQEFTMITGAGHMEIMCPNFETGLGVFHYFTCGDFSFQASAASRLSTINPACQTSMGSAGDNKDNDCDGHRDEDDCSKTVEVIRAVFCDPTQGVPMIVVQLTDVRSFLSTLSYTGGQSSENVHPMPQPIGLSATPDCPAEVTGDLDIYGTSFTFLIPEHCPVTSESISLLVMSDTMVSFPVTVKTPLNTTLVYKTETKPDTVYDTEIFLSAPDLKAATSGIHNTTVHVSADIEVLP
ncbi:IgG Fc-binding protein, partial [Plakobranchus ocellatus]